MADKKITALTENTALASTDLFHVVDSPSSNPSYQTVAVNTVFMSIPAPLAFSSVAAVTTTTAHSLTVARQAITLNSSTFKEAGDTETADSGIMQQVSAAITSAAVTMA